MTQWKKRNAYKILVGISKERNHLNDLGMLSKIIVTYILKKEDMNMRTGLKWLKIVISG